MQNQVRHKFSLVGLQRTGTNYVEQVLRATLKDVIITFAGWKHTFRDETDLAKIGADVVIVARHPVLWLQSCLLNSAKDIKTEPCRFLCRRMWILSLVLQTSIIAFTEDGWSTNGAMGDISCAMKTLCRMGQ